MSQKIYRRPSGTHADNTGIFGAKYSRMVQVKFMEDSLLKA